MSTSIYVLFVKPPDERWQQMKTIYDTCTAAGVEHRMIEQAHLVTQNGDLPAFVARCG